MRVTAIDPLGDTISSTTETDSVTAAYPGVIMEFKMEHAHYYLACGLAGAFVGYALCKQSAKDQKEKGERVFTCEEFPRPQHARTCMHDIWLSKAIAIDS